MNEYLLNFLKSLGCLIVNQIHKNNLFICHTMLSCLYIDMSVAFVCVFLFNILTAGANLVGGHVGLSPSQGYREHGR